MLLPVVCYVKNRVEFKKNPHKDVRKFKVYNCLKTNNTIDILREDLSLSIKSAEHKTQLLVGQKICQQPPESIGSWAFWKKDNQQLGM